MGNNGLELIKIKSRAESVTIDSNSLETSIVAKIKDDSYFLAFLNNNVLVGKFGSGKFIDGDSQLIDSNHLQKLRVFNKNEELLIWKTNGELKARYRKDEEGDDSLAVDAHQVLFGTETKGNIISEERGTSIALPFEVPEMKPGNPKDRVKIHTRNYLSLNEAGQYSYTDSRLIGFTFGKDNKELGGK
ncbi:MAG: CRISPR-associated protein Csx19 [Melioribacteraceae bacterium]|nr:CRISPR-associated protein Csx19 [Melioribacteraceae bacterium]